MVLHGLLKGCHNWRICWQGWGDSKGGFVVIIIATGIITFNWTILSHMMSLHHCPRTILRHKYMEHLNQFKRSGHSSGDLQHHSCPQMKHCIARLARPQAEMFLTPCPMKRTTGWKSGRPTRLMEHSRLPLTQLEMFQFDRNPIMMVLVMQNTNNL